VAFGGIWLAALSIVSIHSNQTPLDRFSNTKSNTVPRSGNVLVYGRNTQPIIQHFMNNAVKYQFRYRLT